MSYFTCSNSSSQLPTSICICTHLHLSLIAYLFKRSDLATSTHLTSPTTKLLTSH